MRSPSRRRTAPRRARGGRDGGSSSRTCRDDRPRAAPSHRGRSAISLRVFPDGGAAASVDASGMPENNPMRVVVAGGGVGGLETLVALNALAGDRVSVTLVAPDDAFTLRALDVFEPFGLGRPKRYPLAELTAGLGVALVPERVARVDGARRHVVLGGGGELPYDALVVAVGAIPYPAFDHGVVFDRARSPEPFDALLSDVQAGRAGSVAVVVPAGTTWALPAYAPAIWLPSSGGPGGAPRPVLTLVTAEREPLQAFGAPAGAMI